MNYFLSLVLLLFWGCGGLQAAPATPPLAVGDIESLALGGAVGILEDASGTLTLDDVQGRLQDFVPGAEAIPNFGQSQSAYWLSFSLWNNSPQDRVWHLRYAHSMMDTLDFYRVAAGRLLSHEQSGRLYDAAHQHFPSRHAVFSVGLKAGETHRYFLRITSGNLFYAKLILLSDTAAIEYERKDQRLLAFYYGIIAAIFVFSIFLAVVLRQQIYFYYLAVILTHHVMTFICVNGIAREFLGLEGTFWNREGILFFLNLAMVCVGEFCKRFLEVPGQSRALARAVTLTQGLLLIVAFLPFLLPYFYASTISTVSASLMAVMMLTCCIVSVKNGVPGSPLFLAGWVTAVVGGVAYAMIGWRLMPVTSLTENAWQGGAAIEALLLSVAIADRIRVLNRQKALAQKASVDAKEELLRMQMQLNEALDKKVRERTEALQVANEKLTQMNTTDELTALRNRRYFNEIFEKEYRSAFREKLPLSVMMLDIDHFKRLNDAYGHPFGDRCLQEAANLIRNCVRRPTDIAARYGGEEFVIVLPGTPLAGALKLAQGILEAFRNHEVSQAQCAVAMTVSIGVVSAIPGERDEHEALLRAADQCLYRAKANGRNRIESAER